jgi:beta-galactosidase
MVSQLQRRLRWGISFRHDQLPITAGAPAHIKVNADRAQIQSDGEDLSYLTVRIEDKDGNLCPAANNMIRIT